MAEARAWYKKETESYQAFEAFSLYLTGGPGRSQVKVYSQLGKSRILIERWAKQHSWQVRVSAYEEQFALKVLDQVEDQRIQLMKEHADFAGLLLRKSRVRIEALLDVLPATKEEIAEALKEGRLASVDQALRAGDLAVKVGRLATGLDGKFTPQTVSQTDLSGLDEEDLDRLEELLDKAKS